MRWAFRGGGLTVISLSLGCATEVVDVRQDESPTIGFELAGRTCSTAGPAPTVVFLRHWVCGKGLPITFGNLSSAPPFSSAERSQVLQAAGQWDEELAAVQLNLPRFTASGVSPQTIRVIRYPDTGSGGWCGAVPKTTPPGEVRLYRGPSSTCGTSTLTGVALQELSHILGFTDKWDNAVGTLATTGHCSGRSRNGQVTGTICQHEIETVYGGYGIRAQLPNYDKHIITGLEGLESTSIPTNSSTLLKVTHLAFMRGNGTLCNKTEAQTCFDDGLVPVTSSNASFTWSSNSSIITLSGSGASRTAASGGNTGQAIVTVNANSTVYDRAASFGDPNTGTAATVTVTAPQPPPPPQNLSASNITATSAKITWAPGDNTALTFLQYRMTGQTNWINANGGAAFPAGQTSYTLTGLHCATSYDVSVYHSKNGVNGTALTLTLFTTGACTTSTTINAPTNFRNVDCVESTYGGKQYATYTLSWTAGSNPSTAIYHIGEAFTNNSGSAVVIRRGPIGTTSTTVGPYLITPTTSSRYFWIRHVKGAQASSWTALQPNPIQIKLGCIM